MGRQNSIVTAVLLVLVLAGAYASREKPSETGYSDTRPLFWSKLYPNGGETLYCGRRFGSNKGREINIEHIFPMSWTLKGFGCSDREQCRNISPEFNKIEADMHNLYPSRGEINQARGSYPFGMVSGERRDFGPCDFEIDRYKHLVEPRPASRGNIARAMFYMHDTYGLTIFKKQAAMLKQWHREDPPDVEEKRRNDIIEKIQGTRNRFIDQPGLVYQLRF